MEILNNETLVKVNGGGLKLSAALFNSISRGINTMLELGRTIGTSIRMAFTKKIC